MAAVTSVQPSTQTLYANLAREIAINFNKIEDILEANGVTSSEWEVIAKDPRFTELLQSYIAEWQSATNTHERVKLKTAAVIEGWLDKANVELNHGELTAPRMELAKLLVRIAGMGLTGIGVNEGGGSKITVNIDLGTSQIAIEKQVTPQVIEGEILRDE